MNTRQHSVVRSTSRINYGLVVLPFLFLSASVIFNVVSFARLGTVGGELYATTLKTEKLHAQNQKLMELLAQKQSLRDTLAQAERTGYVPVTKLTQVEVKDTKVALVHE